jgi:hypothetical protein
MDERLRFIARLLEGEKMAPLCREFGISRVTGHKLFNRYKDCGLDALNDATARILFFFRTSAKATRLLRLQGLIQFSPGGFAADFDHLHQKTTIL